MLSVLAIMLIGFVVTGSENFLWLTACVFFYIVVNVGISISSKEWEPYFKQSFLSFSILIIAAYGTTYLIQGSIDKTFLLASIIGFLVLSNVVGLMKRLIQVFDNEHNANKKTNR